MSCRHDLAGGTCKRCYPTTGKIEPAPEEEYEENLEGPGAITKEEYLKQTTLSPENLARDTLMSLGRKAHENSVNHGFYDPPPSITDRLCLIHAEVSEALDDYRDGHMTTTFNSEGKPVGFPTELSDIIYLVTDLAFYLGIDLDAEYQTKMKYNITRPHKHGRLVF